jgi:hypothetical protein
VSSPPAWAVGTDAMYEYLTSRSSQIVRYWTTVVLPCPVAADECDRRHRSTGSGGLRHKNMFSSSSRPYPVDGSAVEVARQGPGSPRSPRRRRGRPMRTRKPHMPGLADAASWAEGASYYVGWSRRTGTEISAQPPGRRIRCSSAVGAASSSGSSPRVAGPGPWAAHPTDAFLRTSDDLDAALTSPDELPVARSPMPHSPHRHRLLVLPDPQTVDRRTHRAHP